MSNKEKREQRAQERDAAEHAKRKETMKKVGIGVGLVAIVIAIIGIVVALQPDPVDVKTVENKETIADPKIGPDTAKVVIREYSDFQCPACQAAHSVVKNLLEEYGDQVQFVYNDYPLTDIHEYAQSAAISAQCAFDQDKFFEMHDILFERQNSWNQSQSSDEAKNAFRSYAQELKLDMEKYDQCVANEDIKKRIEEDMNEGDELGVQGTPTFFVNGEQVNTRQGYEAGLRAAIDSALAK